MATSKYVFCTAALLILLFAGAHVFAQDAIGATSYVTRTADGFSVTQSLSFPVVPNAVHYVIEIERFVDNNYVPFDRIETIQTRINLSLRVGLYRYRITAYNIMGLWEGLSDWQEINIQPAITPVADSYRPFYGLFYEMTNPSGTVTVNGKDFFADTEFALVGKRNNVDWSRINLHTQSGVIIPDEVKISSDKAELTFNRNNLQKGEYDFFIRNPGGLWTWLGKIKTGYNRDVSSWLDFGYAPMIAAFNIDKSYWNDVNNQTGASERKGRLNRFNPNGWYFRAGAFFLRSALGNFGAELQANFLADNYTLNTQSNEYIYKVLSSPGAISLGLVYQRPITERWLYNFRLGYGIGTSYYTNSNGDQPFLSAGVLTFGAATQYFIWKNLYLNAGLDFQYAHAFKDTANHFQIVPNIGLAWQIGRFAEYAEIAEGNRAGEDYSVPVTDVPKHEHLLSVAWAPMIPLGMNLYADTGSNTRGRRHLYGVNAGGASINYAYLPVVWGKNKFGFDMDISILGTENWKTL
ncbi:MAG: hypothetical protein FWF29_09745, partial [Treponema sp.]|nr:hypothetical protein [Treponema sp.]